MRATSRKTVAVVLCTVSVAAVIVAAASWRPLAEHPVRTAATAPVVMEGVATGEFADGVPVYRLPALTVTATRRVELARATQSGLTATSGIVQ